MISTALVLALLSGLAWTGLDIARKYLTRDLRPTVVAVGLSIGAAVAFALWFAFSPGSIEPGSYVVPAAISIVLGSGVQLCMLESLRRADLGRTIPLLSLTPVATSAFSFFVLDERLRAGQWGGVLLVVIGTWLLGRRRPDCAHPQRTRFDAGAAFMLAAALLISAAGPFDKLAITASSVAFHGLVQSAGIALILVVFLATRGELGDAGRALAGHPLLAGAGALAFAAIALQFAAYEGLMIGIVETVKRVIGLAGALVAGRLLFGERLTRQKLVAVGLMAAGIILLLG